MIKTPNQQSNIAMRDSIFAQFKDDPIFSELLQTNTMLNAQKPNAPKGANSNVLNNNINLQRNKSVVPDNAKLGYESSQQKKKFDDLFNALNNSPDNNNNTTSNFIHSPNNKNNSNIGSNKSYYNNNNDKNKNFLDEFLLDDENVKPSIKKLNKPISGINSTSNMNNHMGYDSGNHVNNKRKQLKLFY